MSCVLGLRTGLSMLLKIRLGNFYGNFVARVLYARLLDNFGGRNFTTYYTANFGAVLRGVGIMHPHASARSPQPPFAGPRDVTP